MQNAMIQQRWLKNLHVHHHRFQKGDKQKHQVLEHCNKKNHDEYKIHEKWRLHTLGISLLFQVQKYSLPNANTFSLVEIVNITNHT